MPGRLRAPDSAWRDSNQPLVPSQPRGREVMSGLPRFGSTEHALLTVEPSADTGTPHTEDVGRFAPLVEPWTPSSQNRPRRAQRALRTRITLVEQPFA